MKKIFIPKQTKETDLRHCIDGITFRKKYLKEGLLLSLFLFKSRLISNLPHFGFFTLLGYILLNLAALAAQAKSINPDHSLCGQYVEQVALQTKVPPEVIWAVARTESNLGRLGPWPWSVNYHGKGYYFNNQPEMLAFIHKKMQHHRPLHIDIGCMQLNLFFHGHKFNTVEEMTSIYKNMLVAAQYLKHLYNVNRKKYKRLPENRIWGYAVGDYHSGRHSKGAPYIRRAEKFLMAHPAWYDGIVSDLDDFSHP